MGVTLVAGSAPVFGGTVTNPTSVPTMPSGLAPRDKVYIVVASKPTGTAITGSNGWHPLFAGTALGSIRITVLCRTYDGVWTMPTLAVVGTTTTGAIGSAAVAYRPDTGMWITGELVTSGADTSSGTSFSATGAADLSLVAGDVLLALTGVTPGSANGVPTALAGAFSAGAATLGTAVEHADAASANGADSGIKIYSAPVTAGPSSAPTHAMTLSAAGTGGVAFIRVRQAARPQLFPLADWLWNAIPPSPVLDPDSAAIVALLADASQKHMLNISAYGTTLIGPEDIYSGTPRVNPTFSMVPSWGPDPFGSSDMPWPAGTKIPQGSDGHVSAADPITGKVYSLWQATSNGNGASWGAMVDYAGDGRESATPSDGSSTGARLSRYAGVIKASEIKAGVIPHALFFSTNMAALAANFRYPAANSDGANGAGVAYPIPEGARVQLDPSINLAAISGITTMELIVGTALQTYGAYCGDNTSDMTVRMGFICEHLGPGTTENQIYIDAMGPTWGDYWDMTHLPWSSMRVLKQWDGLGGTGPEPGRMLLAAS